MKVNIVVGFGLLSAVASATQSAQWNPAWGINYYGGILSMKAWESTTPTSAPTTKATITATTPSTTVPLSTHIQALAAEPETSTTTRTTTMTWYTTVYITLPAGASPTSSS